MLLLLLALFSGCSTKEFHKYPKQLSETTFVSQFEFNSQFLWSPFFCRILFCKNTPFWKLYEKKFAKIQRKKSSTCRWANGKLYEFIV